MKHRLRDRNLKLVDKKDIVQEDPYKLSIHSSANFNKSDSGSKRLNISRMLENSRKKISMRKASELFQSGVRPQSSKVSKRNQVIEFDNIKWISIISAYDPTRLKNVSVSKKTCQKFLQTQGQNIKTDSRSLLYFNDLIKNFKSWLNKIQTQYFYIMEKFLYAKRSVNITLVELQPKLDEVINQTTHMQQNLQDCLKSYENHEFRQLLRKYHAYLQNSKQIEDIMFVVNKSKTKIVDLYKKFDDDKKIQEKLNRVKTEGIHEVKKIICEHNQIQLQNKIMDRIQQAINQMAQKSGEAYRKIKGVKHLISKFKNTEHQSGKVMQKLDMDSINLMGKVCREICFETEAFEAFSTRFLLEGDIINDDLKNIIRKYEQDMINQRKKAIQLQTKFLNIIFSESIKKLRENSKIAVVYQDAQSHHQEYRKILRMIQDIADCLIDQNKKIALQKLIKQTKTVFDRLYEQLKYLKENKKFQQIDTEEGLISILEVSKLIKEYKDKILLVRKKFQTTHRDISLTPIRIESIPQDKQSQFINCVIALSKKINNSNLKDRIQHVECFSHISHQTGLVKMTEQVNTEEILEDITSISNQFLDLQQKNILQKYFGPLKLQNLIFKESIVMLELKKLSQKTKEKNLIPQLTELLNKRNQWVQKHKKISSQMKRYFERILAHSLVKGLKSEDIKQIQNPRSIPFPTKQSQIQPLRSKAKYRQVFFDLIQNSVIQTTKSLKNQKSERDEIQSEHYHYKNDKKSKSKHNFFVSDILQRNISNINNFISAFTKISGIKKNLNSQSYLAKEYLIQFSQNLFSLVLLKDSKKEKSQSQDKQKLSILIQQLINICSDRVLCLTRKILEEQNDWRESEKKRNLDNSLLSKQLPVHVQKVIQVLTFYKNKTSLLSDTCNNEIERLKQRIQNVQNSKEQINQYSKLNLYGTVLIAVVKYCKQTEQIVHVLLDNAKSPIALLNPKENVLKQMFSGLKKGKQLTVGQIQKLTFTIPKIGIQLKIKKSKVEESKQNSKKGKKQSKKQPQQMDEDIIEASSSMKEQMGEQIPNDDIEEMDDFQEPEDQMEEQLGEQVKEEPEQDMIQDFQAPQEEVNDEIEEEKIEQQNLEELLEESQNLGKSKGRAKSKQNKSKQQIDDLEEYDWEQDEEKQKKNKIKLEQQHKVQQQEEKKKRQQQARMKQQEQRKAKQNQEKQKEKRMKKQHIVFSQTQPPKKTLQHSGYEILAFITSLYQLKNLISYVYFFEENFMKNSIQWSKIQQYFNSHNLLLTSQSKQNQQKAKKQVQKYMKSIDEEVESKLKKDFQSEPNVFNEIKNLQAIKLLKKDLLLLKNGNWQILQKMLLVNHVTYNVLKSNNSVLYISIRDPQLEYDQQGSINGYLCKNLKYYQRNQFDIKGYAQKCFNQNIIGTNEDSYRIISYVSKSQRSLIVNPNQTASIYEQLKQTLQNFSNGAKDHVNKFDLCLDIYKKALQIKQKVDLDLNWYSDRIKFLQKSGTDQSHILSYVTFIKDNIKNVIKKIKSLESKLYNLTFKCQKNNIFECIQELNELYGEQISNKLTLKKGQNRFTALVFDKTNYQENLNRIKKILSSEPNSKQLHAEKLIISLLLGSDVEITKQVQDSHILQHAQKINTKEYQLLIDVITTLRINHSYIEIKEKHFQFFTIQKGNNECISNFLKKITTPILQNKQISNLISTNPYLSMIQSLSNSADNSIYQSIFIQSKLQTLFTEKIKESSLYKQVEIIINEQNFDFSNKNWNDDNQKIIKDILESITNAKKEVNRLFSNMTKLKPCKFIYEKHLSKQQNTEIASLWQQYSENFQKVQTIASSLAQKNHWLLAVNSIQTQLKNSVIEPISQNLQVIKTLLQVPSQKGSIQVIETQVMKVFEWIKNLMEGQSKHKFLVVTLSNRKSIVYFDFGTDSFDFEYFIENFNFLKPNNLELQQFLFNKLLNNLKSDKVQQTSNQFKLQKKDVIYQIDTQKLVSQTINNLSTFLSTDHYQQRHKTIRQFVRTFNKIYFVSKTSKDINLKLQSQNLIKLQNEIKKELKQLQVLYYFKAFIQKYGNLIWKGNADLSNLNKLLNSQFVKNEKIPEDQIADIMTKLQKININKKTNTIDSYDPFFTWVYHTIMSLLKLPFYNIITHSVINKQSKTQTQFLAVVVTQNSSDPGQKNQQLQKYLKQMFSFTQHKPIYLKQNDLTVQLTKQPAFIQLSLTIKDIELKQIVQFLNNNYEGDDKDDSEQSQKQFYLRVDEIRQKINSKGKSQEEQFLLELIPLKSFLKSSEQQFNLQISQQKLCCSIECNIVYAPSNISNHPNLQKFLPLNGSSVDAFDDVFMGKHLKLQKLKEWLYTFYKTQKNQIDNINRAIELQSFFNQFIKFHIKDVLPENREVLERIFKKVTFKSISNSTKSSKQNALYLPSSQILKQECLKNLKIFKQKQCQNKPQLQKLYDQDIKGLIHKIEYEVHAQLYVLERQIKVNMEKKIKKSATQKLKQIEQKYLTQKEKKPEPSNETVDIPQSQPNIKIDDSPNKSQQQPAQIQIPIQTKIDPKQKQKQLLAQLREEDFDLYIEKRLEYEFETFSEESQKEINKQILDHFTQKISKCQHNEPTQFTKNLSTKVNQVYENKQKASKQQIIFLYFILKNNDIVYAELFISEDSIN